MEQLSGKVAIVTGAAQGIGRGVAVLFARRGADLAIWDTEDLVRVKDVIVKEGRRCLAMKVNVTCADQVNQAVRSTVQELGGVDILVNCAGVHSSILFKDMTEKDWDFGQRKLPR